ncbi:hypothetical protein J6590_089908 [Homalodisca vitripennis]|nr:hypothetical protein J6590_089908 [Homalodisca vitripennis]
MCHVAGNRTKLGGHSKHRQVCLPHALAAATAPVRSQRPVAGQLEKYKFEKQQLVTSVHRPTRFVTRAVVTDVPLCLLHALAAATAPVRSQRPVAGQLEKYKFDHGVVNSQRSSPPDSYHVAVITTTNTIPITKTLCYHPLNRDTCINCSKFVLGLEMNGLIVSYNWSDDMELVKSENKQKSPIVH